MPSPLPHLPEEFFGDASVFLRSLQPEERFRVSSYTSRLLSYLRMGNPDNPPILQAVAQMEVLVVSDFQNLVSGLPAPVKTAYGDPPDPDKK